MVLSLSPFIYSVQVSVYWDRALMNLGQNKMAVISKTKFSYTFSWIEIQLINHLLFEVSLYLLNSFAMLHCIRIKIIYVDILTADSNRITTCPLRFWYEPWIFSGKAWLFIPPAIYMCQLDGKPIPVPNLTKCLMPYGVTRLQQVMWTRRGTQEPDLSPCRTYYNVITAKVCYC